MNQDPLPGPDEYESALARLEAEVARLTRGIEMLEVDVANAEVALRVERRKTADLRRQLEDRVVNGPGADDVQAVFEYWRRRCDHPRARLDTKRGQAVRARLHAGHSVEELMHAIDGAKLGAFISDTGRRHDELELIMRDEVKLDSFLARRSLAIRSGYLSVLLTAFCLPRGLQTAPWIEEERAWGFKCPVCRVGWQHDHYFPLKASQHILWCDAACVGLTEDAVRDAIDKLPVNDKEPPPPEGDEGSSVGGSEPAA